MMILVTGGSGSGKSAFAEDCIVAFGNARRIYIATMYPFDEESRKRVKRHQAMRQGKGFDTLECYTGLKHAEVSGVTPAFPGLRFRKELRSFWNVCLILLQMRCFRKMVHTKIQ